MKTLQTSVPTTAIVCAALLGAVSGGLAFGGWALSDRVMSKAVSSHFAADAKTDSHPSSQQARWQEARWPFLMDQWGTGRAFHCAARDCGTEINVFVRAKIGFCNCTTGVADDEEIDRIGDIDLISADYSPDAPGDAVAVADMKGRARVYRVATGDKPHVLAVAFSRKCDVMVATAVAASGQELAKDLVLDFLNGAEITGWAIRDLGA